MDEDELWHTVHREQERDALLAVIPDALKGVEGEQADRLREEFHARLDQGGVDSVYALAEQIDWIRLPILYIVVTERFVQARIPPERLTKRERERRAREQNRLAKMLRDSSRAAEAISGSPRWCAQLAPALEDFATALDRLASEASSADEVPPTGRPMKASTQLALALDDLFWRSEIPMVNRCRLIAAVVTAFIEPVTGEQIRQRIKDLRRRPRSG